MKDIFILGAGTAGISLVEKLKEKNCGCRIALADNNSHYFDKKSLIENFKFKNALDLKQWVESSGFEFIQDTVERVNLKRRKIKGR